jgi:alpha-glucosidase (family GH31 glycosyl hydrolase)
MLKPIHFGTKINQFYNKVPFDGLWIDMNELVGFCNGECKDGKKKRMYGFDPNHPPYVPGDDILYYKTIWLDSITSMGIEYNTHSLYGFLEMEGTKFVFFSSKKQL